ncbi:E3 ubiquitin-protein ligase CCNB1IP1 [Sesamum angolense]|uniref:E3 ubiquitin-protein ligase CCNB1IP1 n=1 Tax=Sesamum angolense TaxID=2727404 RepID=A0AAE1WRX7_9LAMI|nr:E3 ubiquitin-protein ligase CCNB1IP1 [Sesamum angolense]
MRCNACWRELEGRAITTTCGHLLCPEDASKILSNDGACPICDQVLSKSLMKPVDINPNDEWVNMAMAGISPQILMKSAYRSVMFYIGQKDLEMQVKMNKVVGQCRQKCEAMQEKFTEKLEQIYTAYQKMTKRCQMMEQEMENLSKDKQELQEKLAEKCRQKRKLDEIYDQARNEIESLKRSAIHPANNFFSRPEPDLFSDPATRMDNRDPIRKDWSVLTPNTPGPRDDMWPPRHNNSNSTFDMSGDSPAKQAAIPIDTGNRMPSNHPSFGVGTASGAANPSMTLRNLILSPIRRPQLTRSRPPLFTL